MFSVTFSPGRPGSKKPEAVPFRAGRRRSAGPLAARRGSGLALKRGSVGGKEVG